MRNNIEEPLEFLFLDSPFLPKNGHPELVPLPEAKHPPNEHFVANVPIFPVTVHADPLLDPFSALSNTLT
jgi:hypothetical protein